MRHREQRVVSDHGVLNRYLLTCRLLSPLTRRRHRKEKISTRTSVCCFLVRNVSVSQIFSWNVHHFIWFTAFRILNDQFPILNILRPEFEYLTYSHPASGHHFWYQPITDVETSENDFIDDALINYFPLICLGPFEYLPDNCRVTWVLQIRLRGIDCEVGEGSENRIAISLCRFCVVLG